MGPAERAPECREARRQLRRSQVALHIQGRLPENLRRRALPGRERFIAIGPIRRGLVLVVFTERREDTNRIISARWASKTETALYVEFLEDDS